MERSYQCASLVVGSGLVISHRTPEDVKGCDFCTRHQMRICNLHNLPQWKNMFFPQRWNQLLFGEVVWLFFSTAPHLQGSVTFSMCDTVIFPMLPLHILMRPGLICVKCDGKNFLCAVYWHVLYCAASKQQYVTFNSYLSLIKHLNGGFSVKICPHPLIPTGQAHCPCACVCVCVVASSNVFQMLGIIWNGQ